MWTIVRPGDLLRLVGIGSGGPVLSGIARSSREWSSFLRSPLFRIGIVLAVLLFVVPSVLVFPFRWLNPPTTSFILQYSISSGVPHQDWTTWDEMSPSRLPDRWSPAVRRPLTALSPRRPWRPDAPARSGTGRQPPPGHQRRCLQHGWGRRTTR